MLQKPLIIKLSVYFSYQPACNCFYLLSCFACLFATILAVLKTKQCIPVSYTHLVCIRDSTCSTTTAATTGTVSVAPGTVGGTPSSLIVCTGFQPGNNISLVGSLGDVLRWEKSTDASFATGVTNIVNTSTTLTAAEVGTVSAITYVRALVQSGACSQTYSSNGVLTPVVKMCIRDSYI